MPDDVWIQFFKEEFCATRSHDQNMWHSDVPFLPSTATPFSLPCYVAFIDMQNVYMTLNLNYSKNTSCQHSGSCLLPARSSAEQKVISPVFEAQFFCIHKLLHQVIDCIMQHFTYECLVMECLVMDREDCSSQTSRTIVCLMSIAKAISRFII